MGGSKIRQRKFANLDGLIQNQVIIFDRKVKKMKVALIYTENDIWAFGIRSISAVLKEGGHSTKILMVKGLNGGSVPNSVMERIAATVKDCRIIGFSSFSPGSNVARQICERLRRVSSKKIFILGGVHAMMNAEECARFADLVCVGEGEEFMLDLAKCVREGKSWKHLPNAVYIENGVTVKNEVRPLIKDLDALPKFDFSFDEEYHLTEGRFESVKEVNDSTIPIMFNGTRGCAFSCNYCSNAQIKSIYKGKGRYVRKLSPEKYIKALQSIRKKFPAAKYFNLVDEDFFAYSKDQIKLFADLYKEQIGIPFECMGSPRNAHKEKIVPLAKAGLWRVNMGVESGSERTKREVYNRHIKNREVIKASDVLSGFKNVILNCFIIIGNPYEKSSDLIETVELFKKMSAPYFLTIYNLIFFPGTPLYRMALEDRIIRGTKDSGYEMNFLAGYNYQHHGWKNTNLYLNGLIYLMMGKVTRNRMGMLPHIFLDLLLKPGVIAFNEKHPSTIKFFIYVKRKLWRARSMVIKIVKRYILDPTVLQKKATGALQVKSNSMDL